MKKLLALILFLTLLPCGSVLSVSFAEDGAPDGILGEWFAEAYHFPESYPDVSFAGTNYSRVLEFMDDGMMNMSDPFNGTSRWTWSQEGSVITISLYLEPGETRDPELEETAGTISVADEKLIMQLETPDDGEAYEMVFSREPAAAVVPGKRFPESMEEFAGTWRISGFGQYGSLVAAADMNLEGTAEITENVLVMKCTKDGEEQEYRFEFEPQLMYDSLFRTENGQTYAVTLREDGTLLFIIGHAEILWTFAPTE